ncbi:aminodeoxychorismate synthase component I [Rhodococcus tukisamuensis]|uniref:Para-aminobenzoate synthetase component 1 n=1 Tax=Rhodococcus tukisamuensis TaxID=168276 RepID=A0A1G7CAM6_9NOCA|nr:aminodeoxychorismate synthase component I [Rhodococcus tukisamuensis]SDE35756.1 para-aminobenzoate synthetase component 1 [Rhodococcus tukisamuensis]
MRIDRLGEGGNPAEVLRTLAALAADRGTPPPAALIGDWFGRRAVLAPTVDTVRVDPSRAFDAPGYRAEAADAAGRTPIGGGWIGYRAYPDLPTSGAVPALPESAGGWTDSVLCQDTDGCWWYESLTDSPCPAEWAAAATAPWATRRPWRLDWTAPDRDAHRYGVEECLEAIRAGEVYQACVCTQFRGRAHGEPLDFFADAVESTRPARAVFVQGGWGAIASLSPELYLARHGDRVTSSPIKGTLPIAADPDRLRASVKDVAENVMIVDLVRNDLGHLAVPGSVTVTDLLGVYPAPGVWHLVSTVEATVPPDTGTGELLDATFPPASVTGCPKHRARQLLSQWEPDARGIYCGTVGFASPLAGVELNVAIRTVEFDPDGGAVLGVGGGITVDSDPDAEWQECLDKASSILALG